MRRERAEPYQRLRLADNITSITDAIVSTRSQTIGYDNLNRVASASGAYGSQGYTYDGVGNRLTRTVGGTTETYSYSPTANQIATITSGGNIRSFSYQLSGQVSQDVRAASNTYTFAANNNGRNASAALNGGTVGAYLYNAFEQRVQKIVGPSGSTTTTQFVYDRAGHLLLEANGSGAAQREYIWLDDVPVALVDDTGAAPVLYFIHTDQLGTPQKITDASAVVVWDGMFDPFGNAVGYAAGIWDTSKWDMAVWGGSLSLTNLRFPGQYADAEIALNQNWFRDYDPTIGRYVQSDLTGLRGGLSTYAYANGNPFIHKDPRGLDWRDWLPWNWGKGREPNNGDDNTCKPGSDRWNNCVKALQKCLGSDKTTEPQCFLSFDQCVRNPGSTMIFPGGSVVPAEKPGLDFTPRFM